MSEQTLDGLIAKVKSEAIEASDKEARQIIDAARKEAEQIIADAESKKDALIFEGKAEAEAMVNKGKIALDQAARDLQISVKNDLQRLFQSVLEVEINAGFTADLYTKVISKVMDSLGSNISIALPETMEDDLVNSIRTKVAQSDSTVEIIRKEGLFSGLSITKTEEGWSYDITSEEISDQLSQYLNHKWVELLKTK